jgi:hypothetical protein
LPARTIKTRFDGARQLAHGAENRRVVVGAPVTAIETLAAAEVDVVLVDARRDDDRAIALDDVARALRVRGVLLAVARHEDGVLRGELRRFADGHARAHAERARLVAGGRDDAASPATTTDDDGLTAQARIEQTLDGHEERVEIEAAHPRRPHVDDAIVY